MSIPHNAKINISLIIKRITPAQPCILCSCMSHHGLWCEACEAAMPYLNTPHCPLCALPTTQGECCGHCLRSPPVFNHTIAVFAYRFPLDKLIQAMKYQEQLALSQTFAEKILPRIKPVNLPDYLIAMPLHPAKLRSRGYNQAQLIATKIAHRIKRPLLSNCCHRLRDTPSQATLPWSLRHKNMRDAFSCDTDLTGKRIALVDDVLTTGASLNALAAAVKKKGATQISAWVIARTLAHDH